VRYCDASAMSLGNVGDPKNGRIKGCWKSEEGMNPRNRSDQGNGGNHNNEGKEE
jgi:hypothetical protein